jgi:hypothetical protein
MKNVESRPWRAVNPWKIKKWNSELTKVVIFYRYISYINRKSRKYERCISNLEKYTKNKMLEKVKETDKKTRQIEKHQYEQELLRQAKLNKLWEKLAFIEEKRMEKMRIYQIRRDISMNTTFDVGKDASYYKAPHPLLSRSSINSTPFIQKYDKYMSLK